MSDLMKSGGLSVDLASAFDASPNPYVLLSTDLRIVGANQAYLDVTGRERDDILGQDMFEAFDAGPGLEAQENMRQLRASFERVLTTGERDHLAVIHYAIPVISPSGGMMFEDRFWSATHTPLKDADGRVAWILQHTTDITELERLRRGLGGGEPDYNGIDAALGENVLKRAESVQAANDRLTVERERLMGLFRHSPQAVAILLGADHVFQFTNDAYDAIVGRTPQAGQSVIALLPELEGQGFIDLLDSVYRTGEPVTARAMPATLSRSPGQPPETRYIDLFYQPIQGGTGAPVGVFVQSNDVTDTILATERQKLMIDELNHRVKNTLATVQSIAMQTARSHPDPRTFAEAFQARLLALSHTHDLLTRSHWEGAGLLDILQHETEAHGPRRISLNGPRLELPPAAALSFGMIFHELATNAAKYGALSAEAGRVHVDWTVTGQPRRLDLTWREIDGPPVAPPEHKGFGSRLIERNVRHDLAGEAKLDYASDGFVADFSIPLDKGLGNE